MMLMGRFSDWALCTLLALSCFFAAKPAAAIDSPEAFLQCSVDYLRQNGVEPFLEAYYNLFSITDEFNATENNQALIHCLGEEMRTVAAGGTYRKERFKSMRSNLEAFNAKLAAFLQSADNGLGLTTEQRDFLAWHFASDKEYKTNYFDAKDNVHVVGWDMSETVTGQPAYTLITYGLLRCVVLFAVSSDGSAYFSHNSGILPTKTFQEIKEFVKSHPHPRLFALGVNPAGMAGLLRNDMQLDAPIFLANKESANGTIWSVKLTRTPTSFTVSVNERDLPMVGPHLSRFLDSLGTKPYNYGRTADIYPGTDYVPVAFISLADLYKDRTAAVAFPEGYLTPNP